ncbi:MAG: hypothetical protein K2N48_13415 [Muribaculaceae bacterium]|nr:hypothetical protein [Muribaculaceae bacterium]
MKKFTLLSAALVVAMGANAQLMIDWNEEGQYVFHAEDFIAEGSISWSEDEAAFVCDGTGEGKIMLNLDGKTIDFSEVANIDVKGSWESGDATGEFGPGAWGPEDPLASLYINDAVNGMVNEWMGSRYAINYAGLADKGDHNGEPYYSFSTKIDAFYFKARTTQEGEGEEAVITGSVPGLIFLDEVVLTKLKVQDPQAIAPLFHVWDGFDENAQIAADPSTMGFEDNIGKNVIGGGAVVLGNGSVSGELYADLTGYAGIYAKGTPGLGLRLLFNRPTPTEGITECNPVFDENGEFEFYFTELTNKEIELFGQAYPFVHLNTVKLPWGDYEAPVKIQKFNFIEKGGDAVETINGVKAADAIYNVFGQKVDENYRGIVIKNGKKFINK